MNYGSLFSGVGGMDLGLHRAGWTPRFFAESDPWRRTVLAHHWPGVPIYEDVRLVGEPAGRAAADGRGAPVDVGGWEAGAGLPGGVDLLCGGFPCQDVSVAGRRAGLAGARSGLFHEFARITDALRPRWLLVENVPGLLSSNGGRDFGIVVGTLADIGYGVAWRILDSRFFGVPQRRRRVFIVGAVADGDPRGAAERAGQVLAVGARCEGHPATRGEARAGAAVASLSGLGTGGPDGNDGQGGQLMVFTGHGEGEAAVANALKVPSHGATWAGGSSDTFVAAPLSHGSNPNSNAAGRRREDDENLVTAFHQTQDPVTGGHVTPALGGTSIGMGVGINAGVRRLTPVECERLQAWPDQWTNPTGDAADSRRYAACGDGVTASVAEWIGRRLVTAGTPHA